MNIALSELINGIKVCQEKEGMSDSKFASKLQINQSLWSLIKRGTREPGAKVLKAFAREYPELHLSILNYLAGKK